MAIVGKTKDGIPVYKMDMPKMGFRGFKTKETSPYYFTSEPRKSGKFHSFFKNRVNEQDIIFNNPSEVNPVKDYEAELQNIKSQRIEENIKQTNQRMQDYLSAQKQPEPVNPQEQSPAQESIPQVESVEQPQTTEQLQVGSGEQNAAKKTKVLSPTTPATTQQAQQTTPMIPRTNQIDGGTNAPTNQFMIPNTQGIQFGGS